MINFTGVAGTNDNDVVYTSQDVGNFLEHIFYATAGSLSVQVYINGAWSGDIAFEDLESTAPSVFVKTTTSTGKYRLIGRYKKIRFLQNGGTPSNVSGTHNEP